MMRHGMIVSLPVMLTVAGCLLDGTGFGTGGHNEGGSSSGTTAVTSSTGGTGGTTVGSTGGANASCSDGMKNGDETDTDCGGSCSDMLKCPAGAGCAVDDDCIGGACQNTVCAPTCTDGAQNSDETSIDCGGNCPPCAEGAGCSVNGDCTSGVCLGTVCQPDCKKNYLNGHTYWFCDHGATWTEAVEHCGVLGATLVTIDDSSENVWLLANGPGNGTFIGLNDQAVEGTFQWQDGTPLGFTQWAAGEPKSAHPGGTIEYDCVILLPFTATPDKWYAGWCDFNYYFICEAP